MHVQNLSDGPQAANFRKRLRTSGPSKVTLPTRPKIDFAPPIGWVEDWSVCIVVSDGRDCDSAKVIRCGEGGGRSHVCGQCQTVVAPFTGNKFISTATESRRDLLASD